jgi:hypothetical protein
MARPRSQRPMVIWWSRPTAPIPSKPPVGAGPYSGGERSDGRRSRRVRPALTASSGMGDQRSQGTGTWARPLTIVPRGRVVASGVTVAPADRVPDLLRALPPILRPEQVGGVADRARLRFHAGT